MKRLQVFFYLILTLTPAKVTLEINSTGVMAEGLPGARLTS